MLGARVKFQDRWQGKVTAVEVDETWEVLNVIVRRGFWRWKKSVKLPFSASNGWSDSYIAFDCTSGQAFAREIPPIAAPVRPLSAETPVALPGSTFAGLLVDALDRIADELIIQQRTGIRRQVKIPVDSVAFEGKVLHIATQAELDIYRSDPDLRSSVQDALVTDRWLTMDDRRALAIEVTGGGVQLRGNVRTKQAKERAGLITGAIEGVVAVNNEIVDDMDLESALGQLLDRSGLQRSADVYARSSLGEVTVFGRAGSPGTVREILRAISQTPGVRAVRSRLEVRAA